MIFYSFAKKQTCCIKLTNSFINLKLTSIYLLRNIGLCVLIAYFNKALNTILVKTLFYSCFCKIPIYTMRPSAKDRRTHQENILDYLNRDRKGAKRHCDRVLQSEGKNYSVHESILGAVSDYFRTMFDVEMKEKYDNVVPVDKIPPKRLENILDYAYLGNMEVTEDNVMEVLEDAEYTQMKDLKAFCNTCILKFISVDNCLKLRAYAQRYNLDDVIAKTDKTVAKNFTTILKQEDFMQLDVDDMSAIIEQRPMTCEEAVFTGIVQWVNHNRLQREELFVNLFSQLDPTLMTLDFLSQVYKESMVKNSLKCNNILVEAFLKSNNPASVGGNSCEFALIGGEGSLKECVIYDVNTKQSRQLPQLNHGSGYMTSEKVGDKLHIFGGADSTILSKSFKTCEMLDLNKQTGWVAMPDMLEGRTGCASGLIKNHIYVTGGQDGQPYLSSCEKFDIPNNKWIKINNMLHARAYHGTVVFKDSLYCIGGCDRNNRLSSCERYGVWSGVWNEIAPLNQARSGLACVVLNGNIYAIGGFNKSRLSIVEKYEARMDRWETVASLQHARYSPSTCVIGDKIYVIGGYGRKETLKSVEVYEPTSNAWTVDFEINQPVYGATAVAI